MRNNEYEAVSFAINQLENEIEGASDEIFIRDASLHIQALYGMMNKYKKQRQKALEFQSIRAEVSKIYDFLTAPEIDRLTREAIKEMNKKK